MTGTRVRASPTIEALARPITRLRNHPLTVDNEETMLHRHVSTRIDHLGNLSRVELRVLWEREFAEKRPATLGRDILALGIAYARQERRHGGLAKPVARELDRLLARVLRDDGAGAPKPATTTLPRTGTILVREWRGTTHQVTVVDDSFILNGTTYRSLSSIRAPSQALIGTAPAFLGLRDATAHGRATTIRECVPN